MKAFVSLLANISQKPIKHDVKGYDTLLSFGYFWQNLPDCKQLFALHPLFLFDNPSVQTLRYEIGTEFGVVWLLAHTLSSMLNASNPLTQDLQATLKHIDIGYLASESNLAEEELEGISDYLSHTQSPIGIVLGKELALHPHAEDIALICGILGASPYIDIIVPDFTENITLSTPPHLNLQICEDLPESNGNFIYALPSTLSTPTLKIPPLFAPALKLKDGQHITLNFESQSIKAICQCDKAQKGTIALLYLPQTHDIGYPYKKVEVIL